MKMIGVNDGTDDGKLMVLVAIISDNSPCLFTIEEVTCET